MYHMHNKSAIRGKKDNPRRTKTARTISQAIYNRIISSEY